MKSKSKIIQVSNIAPQATKDQMSSLFGYLGKIEDIRLYPTVRDVAIPVQSRICFIKFQDRDTVGISQHLTNTVFIDRAIGVAPFTSADMPDERSAMDIISSTIGVPGLTADTKWPLHVTNHIDGIVLRTVDPQLAQLGLPDYPNLPATTESYKVYEIRRTVTFDNIGAEVNPEDVLVFAETAGEVKYLKMGSELNGTKNCLVEYIDQQSIIKALSLHGSDFMGFPMKINHSTAAIIKPHAKSNETAQLEIEEAMRRVKDAQNSLFPTNMDPLAFLDAATKDKFSLSRSRSRSRSRRSRSHSKSRRSRSKRRSSSHSGSRRHSRSHRRSYSRSRRSRSGSRRRSRSNRSRSKSKSKRDKDKDKKSSRRSSSRDKDKKSKRTAKDSKEITEDNNTLDVITGVIEKELKKIEESVRDKEREKVKEESDKSKEKDKKDDKRISSRSKGSRSRSNSRSRDRRTTRKRSRSRSRRRSRSRSFDYKKRTPRSVKRSRSRSRPSARKGRSRDRLRSRSGKSRSHSRSRKGRGKDEKSSKGRRDRSRSRDRKEKERERKDRDKEKEKERDKRDKRRERKERAEERKPSVPRDEEREEDKEETVDMDISNSP